MDNQEKKKTVPNGGSENTKPKKKKRPVEQGTASGNKPASKQVKKRPPQFKETGAIPTKEVLEKLAETEKAKKKDGTNKGKKNNTIIYICNINDYKFYNSKCCSSIIFN